MFMEREGRRGRFEKRRKGEGEKRKGFS